MKVTRNIFIPQRNSSELNLFEPAELNQFQASRISSKTRMIRCDLKMCEQTFSRSLMTISQNVLITYITCKTEYCDVKFFQSRSSLRHSEDESFFFFCSEAGIHVIGAKLKVNVIFSFIFVLFRRTIWSLKR